MVRGDVTQGTPNSATAHRPGHTNAPYGRRVSSNATDMLPSHRAIPLTHAVFQAATPPTDHLAATPNPHTMPPLPHIIPTRR